MDNGIGVRLRALRDIAGVDAMDLGRLAGLSSSQVSMVEGGYRGARISATVAIALSRALGCSVEYLVEGTGAAPSQRTVRNAIAAARRTHAAVQSE